MERCKRPGTLLREGNLLYLHPAERGRAPRFNLNPKGRIAKKRLRHLDFDFMPEVYVARKSLRAV